MKHRWIAAAAAWLALTLAAGAANAADITMLCTTALKTVMIDVGPQFEKATGHKLHIQYSPTGPAKARIEKGEAIDVTILGTGAINALIKGGKLVAATRTDVARSAMGVAIRKGAPKPDLSSADSFKKAMLNSKGIAYAEGGLTGDFLKGLFQRLGIADQMKAKTVLGRGAETVAEGKAEFGLTQISEILPIEGAELAGPLPPDIQEYTVFPGAVSAGAAQPDAAKALLKFLTSPEAVKVIKAKGLEPAA
jgi:molybdate transport system substrate-binding protein